MKKSILIFVFVLTGIHAGAQLEKGRQLLGVQLPLITNDMYYTHLAFSTGSGGNDYGISINPTYGYAIEHNWVLGLQATFGIESLTNDNSNWTNNKETYTDLGLAPFTRFYVDIQKKGKLKIFGMAAIEFNHANSRFTNRASGNSFTGPSGYSTTGSLGAGIAWFGKKISLDASMSNTALRVGIYHVLQGRKK